MNNEQIAEWLRRLLEIRRRLSEDEEAEQGAKLNYLYGYIDSAESIINDLDPKEGDK